MAGRFLSRGVRIMATGVVLCHGSPKCQVGGCPRFPLGPPPQLMSWVSRGLSWGPAKDVPILQSRIRDLFEGDFNLAVIIQVMLVHSSLADAGPFACGSSTQRDRVPFKVSSA